MSRLDNPKLLAAQYRDGGNLNARIQLHARFSENPYGWMPWVLDQIDLPPATHQPILEIGCGTGELWRQNLARKPPGWALTLTDLSAGMVAEARAAIAGASGTFRFVQADAQCLPFPDGHFAAVIANHMLYHVPDRARAFAAIRRVLKPGGTFYAATVGRAHLQEFRTLAAKFDPALLDFNSRSLFMPHFLLEDAEGEIGAWFPDVSLRRYPDALAVTEVGPLVDYILSSLTYQTVDAFAARRTELERFVATEMAAQGGAIRITKDSGLFVARG